MAINAAVGLAMVSFMAFFEEIVQPGLQGALLREEWDAVEVVLRLLERRRAAGASGPTRRRDDRHTRHVAPVGPAIHFPEMDPRGERINPFQGALKNVGHCVGRSTIARILKVQGISPVSVVKKSAPAPHPHEVFMQQVVRTLTAADDGWLVDHRVLICDRETKWSAPVRTRLEEAGIRVVLTPYRAPNANAYAERFVRSIKQERLDRMIPLGERHFRRAIGEFVAHYHGERNHQGLCNELIDGAPLIDGADRIRRQRRLGGLLNYYARSA